MSNLLRQGDSNLANFGQLGGYYITSGTEIDLTDLSFKVVAIQSLDDTTKFNNDYTVVETPTVLTNDVPTQGFPLVPTDFVIKNGVIIFGRWQKVKLAAGSAIVYFA